LTQRQNMAADEGLDITHLSCDELTELNTFGMNILEMSEDRHQREAFGREAGILLGESDLMRELSEEISKFKSTAEEWESAIARNVSLLRRLKDLGKVKAQIIEDPMWKKNLKCIERRQLKVAISGRRIKGIKDQLLNWRGFAMHIRAQSNMRNVQAMLYNDGIFMPPSVWKQTEEIYDSDLEEGEPLPPTKLIDISNE